MNMTRTFKRSILVMTAFALLGGSPSVASAADCDSSSPTADQYCPPNTVIEEGSDPSGSLPFTGYDIGLAALVATGLVGAGIGLSRAAKLDHPS